MSQTKQRPRSAPATHAHKRRLPLGVLVLPVVIAVVIVGALLFIGGGRVIKAVTGNDETPPFDFKLGKTAAVSTSDSASPADLQPTADGVAQEALPTIDTLFTEAFLDPGNWRDGSYDSALDTFEEAARATAEGQLETVTLGVNAGDTYASVAPGKSKVWFRVLFDPQGNPAEIDAIVRFHALAKGKDGTYTDITSHGQFFLHDTGDGWKIFGFSVGRADHETTPPAGPSGGTPVPSTSS